MVVVKKKKGESDDHLLARFRKKVLDSGIILEARDRKHYKPESEKKKERLSQKRHNIEIQKKRER